MTNILDRFRLDGRVAIVTGVDGGLSRAGSMFGTMSLS